MADDLSKRGKADRDRISMVEEWEVRAACDRYQVTEARLREVVAEVGHMRADVERALQTDQRPRSNR